jgi:uncharacterized protein
MTDWHRWEGADLVVTVRVQPRASRDELVLDGERLKARITAPPVDGAANAHLLRFLAGQFGVSPSRLTLVRGTNSREKTIRITAPTAVPPLLTPRIALPV